MIVWTRRVPLIWSEAMRTTKWPQTTLRLCGTGEEINVALAGQAGQYPPFLIEDIAHTVALCAALTGICRFRLELASAISFDAADGGARLRVFSCYGAPEARWKSGMTLQAGIWTRFAPFSLVLIPPRDSDRIRIEARRDPGSLYLAIEAV